MSDRIGAFLLGSFDHVLGDQRAGDGCTQEIFPFIDCSRAQQFKQIFTGKLIGQVFNKNLAGAGRNRFFGQMREFFALADIGSVSDHFTTIIFLQPGNNDRSIQSS